MIFVYLLLELQYKEREKLLLAPSCARSSCSFHPFFLCVHTSYQERERRGIDLK